MFTAIITSFYSEQLINIHAKSAQVLKRTVISLVQHQHQHYVLYDGNYMVCLFRTKSVMKIVISGGEEFRNDNAEEEETASIAKKKTTRARAHTHTHTHLSLIHI